MAHVIWVLIKRLRSVVAGSELILVVRLPCIAQPFPAFRWHDVSQLAR